LRSPEYCFLNFQFVLFEHVFLRRKFEKSTKTGAVGSAILEHLPQMMESFRGCLRWAMALAEHA
jgi:hypothetical protein